MKRFSVGVLLASMFLLSQGAGAFTIDKSSAVNPDGSARFADPDQQLDVLAAPPKSGGPVTLFSNGNSSFSFGISRPDDRFSSGPTSPFAGLGFWGARRPMGNRD